MKPKEPIAETKCAACNGTGVVKVKQPTKPGLRIYAPRCNECDGKGSVVLRD
jgi:DnaJ-class molecular chaperone